MNTTFDPKRALLGGPDYFKRFQVTGEGTSLTASKYPEDTELLTIENNSEKHAFLMSDIAYHHMAQGELGVSPMFYPFV